MTNYQDIAFPLELLPPMPAIATEVIALMEAPDLSAEKLAAVVSRDALMSAKILKIANSSFYAMSRQVSTLSAAIVLIGEQTLKNLVLAVSLQGMHRSFGPIEKMLWEDSIVCAIGSRYLAQRLGLVDPERAFMAGLFRHIGKIVLNNQSDLQPEQHQLLHESVKTESVEVGERERQSWGATHDQIGAATLEYWQLSDVLALVALHHYDLHYAADCDKQTADLICIVNIANTLPTHMGILGSGGEESQGPIAGALKLGLSQLETEQLIEEFCVLFNESKDVFLN